MNKDVKEAPKSEVQVVDGEPATTREGFAAALESLRGDLRAFVVV